TVFCTGHRKDRRSGNCDRYGGVPICRPFFDNRSGGGLVAAREFRENSVGHSSSGRANHFSSEIERSANATPRGRLFSRGESADRRGSHRQLGGGTAFRRKGSEFETWIRDERRNDHGRAQAVLSRSAASGWEDHHPKPKPRSLPALCPAPEKIHRPRHCGRRHYGARGTSASGKSGGG